MGDSDTDKDDRQFFGGRETGWNNSDWWPQVDVPCISTLFIRSGGGGGKKFDMSHKGELVGKRASVQVGGEALPQIWICSRNGMDGDIDFVSLGSWV